MKDNRRDFLKLAGLGGIGFAGQGLLPVAKTAAKQPTVSSLPDDVSTSAPLIRFPRMVQEYFVERVNEIGKGAELRRAALRTKSDAEAYVREVRSKIQQCLGPWPEKTPLNPRITGTLKRDTYKIEKVIFESRPNFPITANLYIPTGKKVPMPAVLGTCGHGDPGKATPIYQSFAQGLARQGYVVLIFDPIGQGEKDTISFSRNETNSWDRGI